MPDRSCFVSGKYIGVRTLIARKICFILFEVYAQG
jgi:hypothetical protein